MARSARPRKQYRPKAIGRPVLEAMRRDLMTPVYAMLTELASGDDPELLRDAWHQLVATLSYMRKVCAGRGAEDDIAAGEKALESVFDRHARTGKWRCTGPELVTLRAAVAACDWELPYLRTDQITAGLLDVGRRLDRAEAAA